MAKTLAEILLGEDMEGGEVFCDDIYNNLKNHWRADYAGDPCAVLTVQPGMIISDAHDDRLYHITEVVGCECSEILQACVPLSDDVYHGYGHDWDAMMGFDEISDALILGIPLGGGTRGMIICDAASVPHDFSPLVPAVGLPATFWSDGDMDSYVAVGWAGDDLPDIWATRDLNIMYAAAHDVKFFTNAAVGENPYVYIYGWNAASTAPRYARMRMSDINDEFVIATEDHADVEGITISLPETNQRFRIRQNADYIAMYLDGTDVWFRWSDGELNLQTDEGVDTDTIVNILGNGTGHGILQITGYEDIVFLSALAAGGDALTIDAYQDDTTGLTGLLRGAYIQASNGDEIATGIIRALELKARAGRPGEVGANADHLEGLSISADAKSYDITLVMRGAEIILDGGVGANVTKAVGVRIAQNFQADIATLCYGLEFYWDSFEWDADIALASGGLIGGKAGHLRLDNTGVLSLYDATLADRLFMWHDGTDAFISWADGTLNLQTDETDAHTLVHVHGSGAGFGRLTIFDEDDAEFLSLYCAAGVGHIRTQGAAAGGLRFLQSEPHDISCWLGIAAGNPYFYLYGWNTAESGTIYTRLQMSDTIDEFIIETENSVNHEGITVSLLEANQEFRLRGVGGVERFHIDQTGILGYMRQGELFQWTYQGDLADDASFTLPAFTDACWGMIQAGDNEEYALFSVDDVGNVTLISNSANVVANADIDDKLVLGTAVAEPLVIRNRLGATKNINLIIWYS